jgi:peptide/nickel transport system substrate-binding protein
LRDYVYETLLARSYDEPFSLYGLLAESVDTPPDRSSVTFQIRPQARFSDGSPVTPEDVLFSWRLLKEKWRPNHRSSYAKVAAAEKVGERGVKFTFEGSDREMPLIMGLMPVLSRRAFTPESFDKTTFEKPLATGPYVVDAIEPGAGIGYRRNPDYWGRDLPLMRGQYNFDIIRIDYYRDSTTLYEALQRGLVDVEGDSDSIDAARWAEADGIPAVRAGLLNKLEFSVGVPEPMAGLVFNNRRAQFEDRRVREALTLLFDFEWINKTLFRGLYTRTESYFDRSELSSHGRAADARERALLAPYANEGDPAVMDGTFSEPASDGSGTNREARKRAIALFAEAGYSLREGRMVRTATGEPLAFEMTCVSPEQERLMMAYSRFLRLAGVASSVRIVD